MTSFFVNYLNHSDSISYHNCECPGTRRGLGFSRGFSQLKREFRLNKESEHMSTKRGSKRIETLSDRYSERSLSSTQKTQTLSSWVLYVKKREASILWRRSRRQVSFPWKASYIFSRTLHGLFFEIPSIRPLLYRIGSYGVEFKDLTVRKDFRELS